MPLKRIDVQPTREALLPSLATDHVGRHDDLKRLIGTLENIKGPFSIFLDSAWGDGKTFLVRQLEFILKMSNENIDAGVSDAERSVWANIEESFRVEDLYLPVYFNAWENDDFDDPLVPLLATLAGSCEFADTTVSGRVRDKVAAILDSITGLAGHPLSASNTVNAFSGKDLLNNYAIRRELRERFDFVAQASLEEVANRLVVFIDELDRCEPRFAIKLLEQTKALFSSGEVVLVFSTNTAQLAHAIRGLYGESFDAEKYLERFYDMKEELEPVDGVRYLKYIGFDSTDQNNFTIVANGFINMLHLSMRDANRLFEHLKRGQSRVTRTIVGFSGPSDAPVYIAEGVLLPAFIAMSYERPDMWKRVLRADDFSEVYDYAKRCSEFLRALDHLIGYWMENREKVEIDDELRRKMVEWVCALVFIDDFDDGRHVEARDGIGSEMWHRINTTMIRSLGMEG